MSLNFRLLRGFTRFEPASLDTLTERVAVPEQVLQGMASQCDLQWHGSMPRAGWYMLEFMVAANVELSSLYLQVDYGAGFEVRGGLFLSLRRGRVAKRICYFPRRVRAIRFSLAGDGAGSPNVAAAVEHCRLAWLAPYFARDRLAQRLANMHFRYRNLSRSAVVAGLRREAKAKDVSVRDLSLIRYGETFHKRTAESGYEEWLGQVERPFLPSREAVQEYLSDWADSPEALPQLRLFVTGGATSVTSNSILKLLKSIERQSYPHWRLTLALPEHDGLAPELLALVASEHRISTIAGLLDRKDQGEVQKPEDEFAYSESMGSHVYLCRLPEDGILTEHALFFVAESIFNNPRAQIIYSDEDRLKSNGKRSHPCFKPGWNPDWLLSFNYIGDLCFYRADLPVSQSLRSPWTENYPRLLGAWRQLQESQVVSIPRVLVHRTRLDLGGECPSPQISALQAHESCSRLPVTFSEGILAGSLRAKWPLPKKPPLVSLLIPTRDGVAFLRQCVDSILRKTDYPNFEILILDNGSSCAETLTYISEVSRDSRVSMHLWNHPFNYSAINNFGARLARGDVIGLINNDIEVINAGWLSEMTAHVLRPEIGCVGAKLYYGNNTIQHGGVILGIGGAAGHSHKYARRDDAGYMGRLQVVQNLSAVTAACLLVRRPVFEQVGGLNEDDLAIAYNDVDFCLKVREAGYRNLWTPYAELYHHESLSRGADDTVVKRRRAQREAEYLRRRWGTVLDSDPAYNPNLTLIYEDFSLR